jgi:MFS family permease
VAREVTHRLPESAAGAALDEGSARALAEQALRERLQLTPPDLRGVSAEARQRPTRRDWLFTYAARGGPDLGDGEARIDVDVAGDEVVSVRRYVHVPESWQREERSRSTRSMIVSLGSAGLVVLLLLVGVVVAVLVWSRGGFAVGPVAAVALAIVALQCAGAVNGFPSLRATFTTAEPVRTQLFEFFAGLVVAGVAVAGGLGLLAGLAHTWLHRRALSRGAGSVTIGIAAGFALAGGVAAASKLLPSEAAPEWPSYDAAVAYFPALQPFVESATAFIAATAALLLLVAVVERVTAGWTRRRTDATITLLWIGVLLYGIGMDLERTLAADLLRWGLGGAAAGVSLIAVYHLYRRFGPAPIPLLTVVLLSALRWERALARPLESSLTGALLGIVLTAVAALWWNRSLERGAG